MEYASIIAAIIAAVASIAGSVVTNAANVNQTEENRRFQERLSSTAHQREVIDLRNAGLNPILSANRGASTPPGSNIPMENPFQGVEISSAFETASQIKKQKAEIKTQEDLQNLYQQEKLTQQSSAGLNDRLSEKAIEDKKLSSATAARETQQAYKEYLNNIERVNKSEFHRSDIGKRIDVISEGLQQFNPLKYLLK